MEQCPNKAYCPLSKIWGSCKDFASGSTNKARYIHSPESGPLMCSKAPNNVCNWGNRYRRADNVGIRKSGVLFGCEVGQVEVSMHLG